MFYIRRAIQIAFFLLIVFNLSEGRRWFRPKRKNVCTGNALLMYMDCKICVCPRPNRPRCFKKTCDLRTKDSGQCPPNILRLDDSKLCEWTNFEGVCKVDDDCPGDQLCCFDFCKGGQCKKPIPLDPGRTVHGGRGYRVG